MCDRYGIGVLSRRWGEVQMVNFKVVLKTEFRFVSHTRAGGMKVGGIHVRGRCVVAPAAAYTGTVRGHPRQVLGRLLCLFDEDQVCVDVCVYIYI